MKICHEKEIIVDVGCYPYLWPFNDAADGLQQ